MRHVHASKRIAFYWACPGTCHMPALKLGMSGICRDGAHNERPRGGRSRFDEAPAEEANSVAHAGDAPENKQRGVPDEALPAPPPGPPGPPPRREGAFLYAKLLDTLLARYWSRLCQAQDGSKSFLAVGADREWNKRRGGGDGFPEDRAPKEDAPPVEPNFGLSGKLAEEANTVRGVAMLHSEPPEARRPGLRWRLYTFKNGTPQTSGSACRQAWRTSGHGSAVASVAHGMRPCRSSIAFSMSAWLISVL